MNPNDPFIREIMARLYPRGINWREENNDLPNRWSDESFDPNRSIMMARSFVEDSQDRVNREGQARRDAIRQQPKVPPITQATSNPPPTTKLVKLRNGVAKVEIIDGRPVFRGWEIRNY